MTRLNTRSRMLMGLVALLLTGLFITPLWRIELLAPQYPEGLGMLIRLSDITGIAPNDLNNINALNHYIGMKAIVPESIPVLAIMPWVVGSLILFACLTAFTGLRALLGGWLVSFAIAGLAGLVEFYLWSYDYGHNLAPDAIIKVPGMSYEPPLIGTKQLLNFTAASWPDVGSWLALAAFALGAAVFLTSRGPRSIARPEYAGGARAALATVLIALIASSCSGGPRPIDYGRADCTVCRMRITDKRFGGEVVSSNGKIHQFDTIECLAEYVASAPATARAVWVTDFEHPGVLISAETAVFVRRPRVSSGMGGDIVAVSAASRQQTGDALTWAMVQALARRGELRDVATSARGD
jgi:copper chaperone NosL